MASIEHFPLMVPGASPAPQDAEVRAPFDGSPLATVEQVDGAGVERALATAYDLFQRRDAWLSPAERIAILRRRPPSCSSAARSLPSKPLPKAGSPSTIRWSRSTGRSTASAYVPNTSGRRPAARSR